MTETNRDFFEVLARVLLRCWIIGFGLMIFSLLAFVLGGAHMGNWHTILFGIKDQQLSMMVYWWLGLLKAEILLLFFIPWIAIRLVLRQPGS